MSSGCRSCLWMKSKKAFQFFLWNSKNDGIINFFIKDGFISYGFDADDLFSYDLIAYGSCVYWIFCYMLYGGSVWS
jgi:hypothetical protein